MAIPETQKALVFETPGGPIQFKDRPVPKPGPNELLLKMKYSGVCHSDLHAWKGDWARQASMPLVGGHEGVGQVVAMGSNVQGWKIGDYAGVKWLYSTCQHCDYCQDGDDPCCLDQQVSGYTHDGSFQQYAVADAIQAPKIPKGVDLASVAPILCAGVSVYAALQSSGRKAGEWICVSGAGGGLGSLAVQYAKAMGFRVVGVDCGEEKEAFVQELGVDAYVDAAKEKNVAATVKSVTGGGAHAVLNVSTATSAMQDSLDFIRPRGTVVLLGVPGGESNLSVNVHDTVAFCYSVKGSAVGNRKQTQEAIELFGRGLIKCPIKIIGMRQLRQVFELMEERKIMGRYVLDLSY
ncbi:uncharacterized protein J8A68_005334 [[Candida] subhashii]|uniref:alcohol dehydrogenase n=1 Tax=[Candida] subhashii TaxID=561895 RepID=A0A8J5Q6N4_9ASCO|nr:uncharacterized protein J8A68_005334 [[Candida] subhashii]KAG7661161.1 hypothetical protein J8A68_005334 [[Candida] subhashii]